MSTKTKRIILGVVGAVIVGLCIWMSPLIRALIKVGLPSDTEQRTYSATSIENLQAIRTALLLYHDNEGQFPEASGWMEAIQPMLKTNDLSAEEAGKKLKNPSITDLKPDEFGYSLNPACSAKYKGDLPETTILVFESPADRKRNAAGNPNSAEGLHGITIDGNVKTLTAEGQSP